MGLSTSKEITISDFEEIPDYLEDYGMTGLLEHLIGVCKANSKSPTKEVGEEWAKCQTILEEALSRIDKEIGMSF